MGGIDFNVFVNDTYIKKAFDNYDKDGNGYICHFEMQALLQKEKGNENISCADIDLAMKEFDKDGDKKITFKDFKIIMSNLMKRHSDK